ncbi:TPA: uracil-DNA glycosylase family protein [Photobacterium damselae]
MSVENLVHRIRKCQICKGKLPYPPKPLIQASDKAKILIIGQAPGEKTHFKGRVFDDVSGDRLRAWLGVDRETFYNPDIFNIVPMGFCYPGTIIRNGKRAGDKPPRPECRATWHPILLPQLTQVELVILMGNYAIEYYLKQKKLSVTDAVFNQDHHKDNIFVLPHPSPRNNIWLAKHPQFEQDILPKLKQKLAQLI